ncbi:MAG: hypothetical protein SNJ63_01870 [Sphingomonadaceae bacterium]
MTTMHSLALTVLGSAALLCSGGAMAQDTPRGREAELEERLRMLEAAVESLKADLAAARASAPPAAAGGETGAAAPVPAMAEAAPAPAMAEAAPAPAIAESAGSKTADLLVIGEGRWAAIEDRLAQQESREGFRMGRSTFRIGSTVVLWSAYSIYRNGTPAPGAFIRDFYIPQQIPVGGQRSTTVDAHAKQTRIWASGTADVAGDPVVGYVEADFQIAPGLQGTARTTNGYNLSLRHARVSWRGLVIGQDWTTFQNVAALPEAVDFVGPIEGTVFVRQPVIRWTTGLAGKTRLSVALENPITSFITPTSAALKESDDATVPDVVAKLAGQAGKAQWSLAGIVTDVSINNGDAKDSTIGWGLSAAGRIPFGRDLRHDFRFMLTGGSGIGHYVGLNFAPDGVIADGRVHTVDLLAGFAALRIGWSRRWRSTFMGAFQRVDYPDVMLPDLANKSTWSVAGNIFVTPFTGWDLGLELRHGQREVASGEVGRLDRVEFVSKYSF